MRKAAALLLLLLSGACSERLSLEQARRFQDAEQVVASATKPEDYLEAAARYEELVQEGVESGALYYNLGNTYLQAGQRGAAIAAYRRAERYRPRDPYLRANLESALPPGAPSLVRETWLDHVLFWQDWLPYPGKARATAGVATLCFLAFATLLFWRRSFLRHLAIGLLVMTLLLGASPAVDVLEFETSPRGVVTAEVVARKGNAETFEPAFTEPLLEGAEFWILERRGDWIRVRVGGDLDGWIPLSSAATRDPLP